MFSIFLFCIYIYVFRYFSNFQCFQYVVFDVLIFFYVFDIFQYVQSYVCVYIYIYLFIFVYVLLFSILSRFVNTLCVPCFQCHKYLFDIFDSLNISIFDLHMYIHTHVSIFSICSILFSIFFLYCYVFDILDIFNIFYFL